MTNTFNKKKSWQIMVLGWTLIVYFFYFIIYPFIAGLVLNMIDSSATQASTSPVGSFSLLFHLDVPKIFPYLHIFIFSGVAFIIPICNLIAGILILRLNKKGQKLALVSLTIDFLLRVLFLFTLINIHVQRIYLTNSNPSQIAFFLGVLLFDILLIYFITRPQIKENLKKGGVRQAKLI